MHLATLDSMQVNEWIRLFEWHHVVSFISKFLPSAVNIKVLPSTNCLEKLHSQLLIK